jgi:predicted GNAT family acetyltransferase
MTGTTPEQQQAHGEVQHDPTRPGFTLTVDGHRSVADYLLRGNVMHLVHTEVHPTLQGQGVAARLVKAALAHARAEGWRVNPVCSYVRSYMRRHPETSDLLA